MKGFSSITSLVCLGQPFARRDIGSRAFGIRADQLEL
jgi:hypothetical protein